jgi:transcriptional regulator with PAS, ATPase and Fis domain
VQGIADTTMQILSSYWWPGNIRELENLIERLVPCPTRSGSRTKTCPTSCTSRSSIRRGPATENLLDRAVSTFERNFIIRALEKSAWNVTGDRPVARHPAEHAQVQDGQARNPRAGRKIRGN